MREFEGVKGTKNWGKIIPWTLSGVLAASLVGTLVWGSNNYVQDKTVAKGKGIEITQHDLYKAMVKHSGETELSQMIDLQLVENEAKKKNIKITSAEIDALVNKFIADNGGEESFLQQLEQYNLTINDVRESQKAMGLIKKLLLPTIKITDQQYKDAFDAMKKEYVDAGKIRASHILVKSQADLKEVQTALKDGMSFADAAKAFSIDTQSKTNGGDLGYFTKADMVTEFANAAFSSKKGVVSEPVKTTFGYHIILVTDLPSTWTLAVKKAELKEQIETAKISEKYDAYLSKLEKAANIKKKL